MTIAPFTEMGYLAELEDVDLVQLEDAIWNNEPEVVDIELSILKTFALRAPYMTKTGVEVVSKKILEALGV